MISHSLTHTLSYNALNHYQLKANPERFALKSAILITNDYLMIESREAVDEATFNTALTFLEKAEVLTKWISSDLEMNKTTSSPIQPEKWKALSQEIQNLSIQKDANALFLQSFQEDLDKHKKGLLFAKAHFSQAYSASYNAYLVAASTAARISFKSSETAFKEAFLKEISKSLLCKPVEPSLFMNTMKSAPMLYLNFLSLLGGFTALCAGVVLLAAPAAGIASIGVAAPASIAIAGGAVVVGSTAMMAGRFFAHKALKLQDSRSEQEVERLLSSDSGLNTLS